MIASIAPRSYFIVPPQLKNVVCGGCAQPPHTTPITALLSISTRVRNSIKSSPRHLELLPPTPTTSETAAASSSAQHKRIRRAAYTPASYEINTKRPVCAPATYLRHSTSFFGRSTMCITRAPLSLSLSPPV